METLKKFYKRVHPFGFWKPVKEELGIEGYDLYGWNSPKELITVIILGIVMLYTGTFAPGMLLLGKKAQGVIFAVIAIGLLVFVHRKLTELEHRQDAIDVKEKEAAEAAAPPSLP